MKKSKKKRRRKEKNYFFRPTTCFGRKYYVIAYRYMQMVFAYNHCHFESKY